MINFLSYARLSVLFVCLATFIGCAQTPPVSPTPDFTFWQSAPLKIQAREIALINEYQQPMRLPNIEHRLAVSAAQAIALWKQDRLRPAGQIGVLTLRIQEASIIEEKIEPSKSLTNIFTDNQAEKYTATIKASFEVEDFNTNAKNAGGLTVQRSTTVSEWASLHDREMAWADLLEDVMGDFDRVAQNILQQQLRLIYVTP